ncbi:MAG: ABC transporter ATP-binding protein [Acholeplasma sp.]|nr:ABC transporter ATP-binding protein [Acholeplasma sp.]
MKNIFKKLKWFIKQEWKTYLLLFFLLLFISGLSLIPAYLLGLAIDTIVSGELTTQSLILLITGLVAIPIIRYFTSYFYNYNANKLAQKLSFQLRDKYLRHLFEMDLSFYSKYEKGDLINRVTSDLEAITVSATNLLEGIVFNFSLIVFSIGVMIFTISWKLTLISVTFMPIGLTLLNIIRHKKRKYIAKHRKIYAKMTETVLESVEGQKTIRAYGEENNDLEKQVKAVKDDINSWRYIVNYENWFIPLFEIVYGIAYVLAFVFGVYYIINSEISLGELITFVSYVGILYGPIIAMSTIFTQINNATIAIDRYYEIMDEKPEVKDTYESKSIWGFNKIRFENVTFKYPFDEKPVIKNINFEILKGQTIGIVGPTGAGKSTLIRQLLREFNVSEGNIFIDDINIKEYKIEDVRNLVGYVPQAHTIFKREVIDNIKIGGPKATKEALDKAVKMADFYKDIEFLGQGLNTMVGESGSTLSGGQKQRLSIARALIKDPEILILDDSLSAVDAKTEDNIIEQLKRFRNNKTNIIIAHRFSAVRDADMILVLENGEITQRGTHEELLREDGWYKSQYINQITMV